MRREILSRLINIAEYSCHMLKPLIANSSLGTFLDHGSENWNISCHISKQECHSHQRFLPSKYESLNPKGTEEGEQYLRPGRLQDVATPSGEHWGTQDPENIGYWPQGAEMHMKGMISVSLDSCIFPIHRKVLNSLTWDIWFSLIHKNTFDVRTTCPLLQTSV